MMGDAAARAAWIKRVLGVDVDAPFGGAAERTAQLLRDWRDAEAAAFGILDGIGTGVLAHPDVRGTDNEAPVRAMVAELPGLVPRFETDLRRLLDAVAAAGDERERHDARVAAMAGIAAYRQRLHAESRLVALESFAARLIGHGAIREPLLVALGTIEHDLAG